VSEWRRPSKLGSGATRSNEISNEKKMKRPSLGGRAIRTPINRHNDFGRFRTVFTTVIGKCALVATNAVCQNPPFVYDHADCRTRQTVNYVHQASSRRGDSTTLGRRSCNRPKLVRVVCLKPSDFRKLIIAGACRVRPGSVTRRSASTAVRASCRGPTSSRSTLSVATLWRAASHASQYRVTLSALRLFPRRIDPRKNVTRSPWLCADRCSRAT